MGKERVRGTMLCCERDKCASAGWPWVYALRVWASTGAAWLRKIEEDYATTAV
jgi:hypothetical protein